MRYGTILQATVAADEGNVFEPSMVVSGGTYYLYYTQGWDNPNMCLATSSNGQTFTKSGSNPLIAGVARNFVFKDGATWYAFVCPYPTQTQIDLYTSSDGVSFTQDTANVLAVGAGGQWDATYVVNSFVWKEGTGDYRMLYEGMGAAAVWKIGYATSPDLRTWTKSGSNPVLSVTGGIGGPWLTKSGATYWLWVHRSPTGVLPTELYRYSSPDLTTWTQNPSWSVMSRRGSDEGAVGTVGQAADPFLQEVGAQTYLYYSGTPDGSQSSGSIHIKLAIANYTLAQLVATNEGL